MYQPIHRQFGPFDQIPDGVYLVRRQGTKLPLVDHYGVLVAGNALDIFGIGGYEPVTIHRTETMNLETAMGAWDVVEEVSSDQLYLAAARASEAFKDPNYYLLGNNCEHTARYIATGEKKSTQVDWVIGAGLVVGFFALLLNRNDN